MIHCSLFLPFTQFYFSERREFLLDFFTFTKYHFCCCQQEEKKEGTDPCNICQASDYFRDYYIYSIKSTIFQRETCTAKSAHSLFRVFLLDFDQVMMFSKRYVQKIQK